MNEKVESLNDQRIKKEDGDKKIALSEIASFLRRTSSKFFFERETEEREEVTVGTTKLVLRNFFFSFCNALWKLVQSVDYVSTINKYLIRKIFL